MFPALTFCQTVTLEKSFRLFRSSSGDVAFVLCSVGDGDADIFGVFVKPSDLDPAVAIIGEIPVRIGNGYLNIGAHAHRDRLGHRQAHFPVLDALKAPAFFRKTDALLIYGIGIMNVVIAQVGISNHQTQTCLDLLPVAFVVCQFDHLIDIIPGDLFSCPLYQFAVPILRPIAQGRLRLSLLVRLQALLVVLNVILHRLFCGLVVQHIQQAGQQGGAGQIGQAEQEPRDHSLVARHTGISPQVEDDGKNRSRNGAHDCNCPRRVFRPFSPAAPHVLIFLSSHSAPSPFHVFAAYLSSLRFSVRCLSPDGTLTRVHFSLFTFHSSLFTSR